MLQAALQNPGQLDATTATTLGGLLEDILDLRTEVISGATQRLAPFSHCYPEGRFSYSALNLAHYLSLRRRDLRSLQVQLSQVGLSSLGRSEAHVLGTLDQVANMLGRALGANIEPLVDQHAADSYTLAEELLEENVQGLFGPRQEERESYVMVTLPNEAAYDQGLVREFIRQGMDCARINCAHGDQAQWEAMAATVRQMANAEGRVCKILMDLAGHKIRTGPLQTQPPVRHVKVRRNSFGQIVAPGEAVLYREGTAPAGQLSLSGELFEQLRLGDRLRFVDARDKKRQFHIARRLPTGQWLAQTDHSAYVAAGIPLTWQRMDDSAKYQTLGESRFGTFPGEQVQIRLHVGDALLLRADMTPGRPAQVDDKGQQLAPAEVSCTHPEVVEALAAGDLVWIDDGKLGAVVISKAPEGVLLSIVHARDKGATVRAEKGFNFPDTPLNLPPLSHKDLQDLDAVCRLADMVGFSFVESLEDMEFLHSELQRRGAAQLPVIIKVETPRAVRQLPDILLGSMGRQIIGVMIARGDLAVELGGVRLAEVQEEILWLCEAAHVPVIWATQVLDSLAKDGHLSRPEFTDAAMAGRADCVMLNKGPHIMEALQTLHDILVRMQAHQRKKTARLRALHW